MEISDFSDPIVRERLSDASYGKVIEELEILDHAGSSFDEEKVLSGNITPVFFGSARNNFGVQLLLDGFLRYAGTAPPENE